MVALGNFDGLHIGHQAILKESLRLSHELKLPAAIMTFEPHPREYFNPEAPKLRLMRLRDKIAQLKALGFSLMFMPRFNAKFAATSADDFISDILVGQIRARHVVTGENFHFGKGRGGNSALLAQKSKALGFGYSAIKTVTQSGKPVSSSAIREALAAGQLEDVAPQLGHFYTLSGHVAHGNKRGRTLGFPTANIILDDIFIPKHGVYAVRVNVGNQTYDAVANIGIRPTFGVSKPLLEVYLFDFSGDLYGKRIRIEFHHFLREEQKFPSIDVMTEQLNRDMTQAKHLLSA